MCLCPSHLSAHTHAHAHTHRRGIDLLLACDGLPPLLALLQESTFDVRKEVAFAVANVAAGALHSCGCSKPIAVAPNGESQLLQPMSSFDSTASDVVLYHAGGAEQSGVLTCSSMGTFVPRHRWRCAERRLNVFLHG